jgi:hypothetical protein
MGRAINIGSTIAEETSAVGEKVAKEETLSKAGAPETTK